jgi:hypothetical protein
MSHAAHTVEGPNKPKEILHHLLSLSKARNLGEEITPDAKCFHILMKAQEKLVEQCGKGDGYGSAPVEQVWKIGAMLD